MVANSAIEWTNHTFSPWWGCTDYGPGCKNCYADAFDHRIGGDHWGKGKPRRLIKDWSGPVKWNRAAERAGVPAWVFIASMCDVFDAEVPPEWRVRLWNLIRPLKWLRIQIVTKRIALAAGFLPADWEENFQHVGLISTIVTQREADRDIPILLGTPARWHGLSMEPLLERVQLVDRWYYPPSGIAAKGYLRAPDAPADGRSQSEKLDWVIVGGESGPGAREFHLEWAEEIVRDCIRANTPVFVKQIGDLPMASSMVEGKLITLPVQASKKGKDMAEWPENLRIRQMPTIYDKAA